MTTQTSRRKHTRKPAPVNQLTAVEMRNVTSELIRDISYSNGELVVAMRNGARYRYNDVESEVVQNFLAADSFGRYFNEHIRHYDYERLDQ